MSFWAKKTAAFTLVEILITILTIGIIAAITIPTINTKIQKHQTVTRLTKIYSELKEAERLVISEYGDLGNLDWAQPCSSVGERYLLKYIPTTSKTKIDKNGQNGITYKQISGKPETDYAMMRTDAGFRGSYIFTTKNGSQIFLPRNTSKSCTGGIHVIVDINGYNKPNTFGKDLFSLVFNPKHGIAFSGMYSNSECTFSKEPNTNRNTLKNSTCHNYGCNKKLRGGWCGALIYADNWKILDDYPW